MSAAHTPERVGRYEILLPIASGGMATVYLARAHGVGGFEHHVALKFTHPHLKASSEFVGDLLEEAKLAARIRHRNVISIIDVGEDPRGVFLVMEYVEGDTLGQLRRRSTSGGERLPASIATRILIDTLAGLHAAHELADDDGEPLHLVHRDVSPQNLLIGLDGVVRLTDFGIAKATTRLGQTQSGLVKGKLAYMSPEQAKGKPLDRRCDVWAAGVVAWELFTGRRLYDKLEDVAIVLRLVSEPAPRLRDVVPTIHPALEEAVARALALDIDQRTPTALAFSRELSAAARAAGEIAEHDEVAELVKKLVGPKLAERRRTAAQIASLHTRAGQLIASSSTASTVLTPSEALLPADDLKTDTSNVAPPSGAVSPSASALVVAGSTQPLPTPIGNQEGATGSGTTSVSASLEPSPRRGPKLSTWTAASLIGLALTLTFFITVIVWRVRASPTPEESSRGLAASATMPVGVLDPTPAEASTTPTAPAATPAPSASSTAQGVASVSVHANVPVSSLRVNGRAISLARAQREFVVALQENERASPLRIDATAFDGRIASATASAGASDLRVDFPAAPVAAAPVAAAPVRPQQTPTPLRSATRPAVAPLAADPYKR